MSATTQEAAPAARVRRTRLADDRRTLDDAIADAVRQKLSVDERGPSRFYFNDVRCECCNGIVKLEGRVPTYRLKRLLLSLIENLDGIQEIDDRVECDRTE
ncbi:hypothetical protein Pan97_16200 [Bremerella volcania]|uniref:BON domain-containing protein n=1 Tax=Bremerella volcania TaxID=2527984 RepID=A0A518C5V9_9BACT|nr:BON domain-containing protein [Bremerella volcania]QDU74609.1 hypothetical protein Pan97_16200 [Bremerella volcania]